MRIFSRKRSYYVQHAPRWYDNAAVPQPRASTSLMRRPVARTLPAGPRASVEAARESVHEQADRSRAEIKALVEAERAEVAALVEDSVKGTEERLRGATENRVDIELDRIREAEKKMRAEISESVKAEVARTIAQLRSKRQPQPEPEGRSKPPPTKSSNGGAKSSDESGRSSNGKPKSSSSGSKKVKSAA